MRFLFKFILILLGLITLYSFLFHWIMEGEQRAHSWVTGFYWTLTVMSTLGFGDITFNSDLGRLFSIVVLLTGVVLLLIMLPFTFIQFFYAPWLEAHSKNLAPRELPLGTRDHVIIIGLEPTALHLAQKVKQYGHEYVLLCPDAQSALDLQDQGFRVVVGDHDDAATYRRLRVEDAAMVVTLDNDMRNTNITFTVREVSPATPILSKVDQKESVDILDLAESTYVFPFTTMLGQTLARRAKGANLQSGIIGRFEDISVAERPIMHSHLEGKTLRECRVREKTGVNVVGVWERGKFELPDPDRPLTATTVLVLAGEESQIEAFHRFAGDTEKADAPTVILGGGRVGRAAAEQVLSQGGDYRIVEKNPRESADGRLIVGNAADLEVLERAGIRQASTVFITTHNDDMNIYLAIYCRRLRPDIQIISRSNLDRNIGGLHTAGADLVISYSSLVANTVVNLLSPGKVLMLTEGLNIFRVPLPPQLIGKTLATSNIRSDTGCNVVAVNAGEGMEINPNPTQPLVKNSELLLIGNADAERRFLERFPASAAG